MADIAKDASAGDPFKCLLGEITEDQWEVYKALRKNQSGLVQDDDSSLASSDDNDALQDAAQEKNAQDAEELRSMLTTKYINGEISFAEFTDRMDSSLTPKEEHCEQADEELDDAFLRPSHRKGRGSRLPRDLQGLVGQANLCFARGSYHDAVKMCMEVVRLAPRAAEPFQTLGMIYEALGEPQRALQFSLIGAYLSPQDADEWSRLGELSLEQGDVHQAIACYVQAVRADPSNVELRFELCSLYEQVGNQQRALACCTALVQQMGHGDACLKLSRELAKVHHQRGNLAAATQVLLNAIKKFPANVSSEDINMLLELQLTQKMYSAALMVLHSHCGVRLLPGGCEGPGWEQLVEPLASFERCEVPAEMPVDLRTKLVLCLVHLRGGEHLTGDLVDQLQRDQDPEEAGDLFLDVAEALMDVGRPHEALPLLRALVGTHNYGMAAVWLRYGECLQQLGRLREATGAYERTCELAPGHAQARLALCQLLLAQGLTDRAIACLESADAPQPGAMADADQQDSACVLLRRAQLLRQSGRQQAFIETAQLLLEAHCPPIQTPTEYAAMFSTSTFRGRTEALRELHQQRSFSPFNWLTADSGVSVNELYQCFYELCLALHSSGRTEELQQATTEALVSPLLNREAQLYKAHYQDPRQEEHTFSMARLLVLKYPAYNRAWNLFGLAMNLSPVMRQNRFCLRLLYKYPDSVPLGMLNGHNALVSGTYKHALAEYVQLLSEEEDPLLLLCAGLTLVHMGCQKFSARRHWLLLQAMSFLDRYLQARPSQEALFNMGRALHQLGFPHMALNMYQRALGTPPAVQGMPEVFDLRCEIAFNMSLLYLNSGNTELASSIVAQHCII
ncbi:general transcription factor 3C polypeptide 3-like isoform X3 [Dermacentor andersoni]|uniref:general transcription factor 3C polypeptide 3-like isoform X3 n=1 Tax=Dermacentor andersoni TaxID=34620 RepID=UPI002417E63B|nr:general transcription factor 3C polypeptide 3-like isoform X3 [Dermacentor andersoni]